MSDLPSTHPSLGVWEFESIAEGIYVADQIIKGAPVASIHTGTIHPGRYLVVTTGDPASVDVARDIVASEPVETLLDSLYLADIAGPVFAALGRPPTAPPAEPSAVGVVETVTVAAAVAAADAAVKDAAVHLVSIVLADGLGGKAYFVLSGDVGEVGSSVSAAERIAGELTVRTVVIPQVTDEIRNDLMVGSTFAESAGFEARP